MPPQEGYRVNASDQARRGAGSLLVDCKRASMALPPLDPDELASNADLIVTGSLEELSSQVQSRLDGPDRIFRGRVLVTQVDKGAASAGMRLEVTYWHPESRPEFWGGPSGQYDLPPQGQVLRWYLAGSGPVYRLLEPNGWEEPL